MRTREDYHWFRQLHNPGSLKEDQMPIEAIEVPVRSRLWDNQDASDAFNLLTQGKAAKFGTYVPGEEYPDEDAEEAKAKCLSLARTQGQALNNLIGQNHGRRWGVTAWVDGAGNVIGALLPREPKKYTPPKGGKK